MLYFLTRLYIVRNPEKVGTFIVSNQRLLGILVPLIAAFLFIFISYLPCHSVVYVFISFHLAILAKISIVERHLYTNFAPVVSNVYKISIP